MPPEKTSYAREWSAIAEKDWQRAHRLQADDPELAGFCLQQAVEKFLKAYLLSHGWNLRRIHDLEALLDDAVVHDYSLEEFRTVCQRVTGFYMVERYPGVPGMTITEEDVRVALRQVEALVAIIHERVG